MSDKEMAQLIINENRQLKTENQELLTLNESLQKQLSDQTTLIGESKVNGASSEARLTALAKFEESHGSLAKVEKALTAGLQISESVRKFVEKHGTLAQVDESLRKLSLRMDHIQESMNLADQASALMQKHGSLEAIGEALTASAPIVEAYAQAKGRVALRNLCTAHAISESKAKSMMEKSNLNLRQLSAILESVEDNQEEDDVDECDGDKMNEGKRSNPVKISEGKSRRGINEELVLPAIGSVYKNGEEVATVDTVGEEGVTVTVGGTSRTIGMGDFAQWTISEEMAGEGNDPLVETEKPDLKNTEDNPDLNKVNESKTPGSYKTRSRADSLVTGRNFIESERPSRSISEGFKPITESRSLSRFERMVTQENRAPRSK